MADTNSIRRDCRVCDSVLNGLKQLYCSKRCGVTAWIKANPEKQAVNRERAKQQYLIKCPPSCFVRFSRCSVCNTTYTARSARTERCHPCTLKANAAKELEREHKRHKTLARVVACTECHIEFCPLYGSSNAVLCLPCSQARERQHHAVHRANRKARQKGLTYESVNPIKVLQRDRWTCQLCQRKTPARLRGTYNDLAPELDHIIPLSLGGPHTYANTQCACRKCNGLKSNRPMGQTLLFG